MKLNLTFFMISRGPLTVLPGIFVRFLHLFALLVRLLDDGELRVGRLWCEAPIGRVLGAVKHQRPFLEPASLRLLRIEADLEQPSSLRVLAPRLGCHEGPFRESVAVVVVVGSFAENH